MKPFDRKYLTMTLFLSWTKHFLSCFNSKERCFIVDCSTSNWYNQKKWRCDKTLKYFFRCKIDSNKKYIFLNKIFIAWISVVAFGFLFCYDILSSLYRPKHMCNNIKASWIYIFQNICSSIRIIIEYVFAFCSLP